MRLRRFLLLLALWPAMSGAQQMEFSDPAGDDYGPGSYRYPDHPALGRGSFDLRRLSLRPHGDRWLLEVEFDRPVRKTDVFFTRDDRRRVFLQTVDVYLRLEDGGPGRREALPGREVIFSQDWHRAVVLSPAPDMLRAVLPDEWRTEPVLIVERVMVSGRRLRASLPAGWLGGDLQALSVLVTGTSFDASWRLADRLRDEFSTGGLVMPVVAHAPECRLDDPQGARCALYGCSPCGAHPRVMDLLAPTGMQERWLSGYDAGTSRPAEVELVPVPAGGR